MMNKIARAMFLLVLLAAAVNATGAGVNLTVINSLVQTNGTAAQIGNATVGNDVGFMAQVNVTGAGLCNVTSLPSDRVVGANTLWVQDKVPANVSLYSNGTTWVSWICNATNGNYTVFWKMPAPTEMKTATVAQNGSQAYIDENSTQYEGWMLWTIKNVASIAIVNISATWTDTNATCVTNCIQSINLTAGANTTINVTFTTPITTATANTGILSAFPYANNYEVNFTDTYARTLNYTARLADPCPTCSKLVVYRCKGASCPYTNITLWTNLIFTRAGGYITLSGEQLSDANFVVNWETSGGAGSGGGLPPSIIPPMAIIPIQQPASITPMTLQDNCTTALILLVLGFVAYIIFPK